jgi:predicted enzyme related to lactoylglutathione lyase
MPNPVVHFEISGRDGKQLQSFYAGLFDWKVDANNPMDYGIVEAGGPNGIGGGISASQDGSAGVTVYVEVDDPQAYLDKAVGLGGKLVMPVTDIPGAVTMAQFSDPAGNMIGLIKAGSGQQ